MQRLVDTVKFVDVKPLSLKILCQALQHAVVENRFTMTPIERNDLLALGVKTCSVLFVQVETEIAPSIPNFVKNEFNVFHKYGILVHRILRSRLCRLF